MVNKAYLLIFILFVIFFTSCGGSISDIGQDAGIVDIKLNDVNFEDVVKDTSADIGGDTENVDILIYDSEQQDVIGDANEDALEDTAIIDSEVDAGVEQVEDAGNEDAILSDEFVVDVSEDVLEDIQEDIAPLDVVEDINQDSGVDTGFDTGADTGEDAGTDYCKVGEKKYYQCPDGNMVDWCICDYKGCKPHCDKIGTESEGWYDCNGKLIKYASCAKCSVECDKWGTKSEGWYSNCDGLITWDQCAPDWFCLESPEVQCEQRCTDSCDCPDEKPFCVNGICDKIAVISCNNNNNLCPCGYYCDGKFCVEGSLKCKRSCDCKEGQICVNGACKDKFDDICTNEPCPCNFYCEKGSLGVDTCQKGCQNNCDCPSNAPICSSGMCVNNLIFDCKGDDRLCPCMQRCVDGECVKSDELCDNSCECINPLRQVCVNMVCTDGLPDCNSDQECPCGQVCKNGSCVSLIECKSSCDCPKNNICQNGKCVLYNDEQCKTDLDCPCEFNCINSACVPFSVHQCTYSCDCPENMICQNGNCEQYVTYKCLKDNDCLCGNYCDLSSGLSGFCITGCNDPCDCPNKTPYCVKGSCAPGGIIPVSCKSNNDCKCGEICKNGMCISSR